MNFLNFKLSVATFILLKKAKIPTIDGFNIYEQTKFHSLRLAWKTFYYLGAWCAFGEHCSIHRNHNAIILTFFQAKFHAPLS